MLTHQARRVLIKMRLTTSFPGGLIVSALLFCLIQQQMSTSYAYIPISVPTLQNGSVGNRPSVTPSLQPPPPSPSMAHVNQDVRFRSTNSTRWGCTCYNKSEDTPTQCKCMGMNLLKVPQDMPLEIERLTMLTVGIVTLRTNALKNYTQLTDLILSDLPQFKNIVGGAFKHLQRLRTIYISNAPELQVLSSDTFKGMSKSLKSLRIVNSGLTRVPNMGYLNLDQILTMVDLEGNRISNIPRKSITLKTEQLILANNDLTSVDGNAFQGSSIARLSLKGNTKLVDIHKSAFGGMVFIRELDLSETSVVSIPTEGLDKLEVLRIQNTHSLKIIPSVFNFKSLQEAWLTHSFHCCAFIFPSRHDPENYARLQKHLLRYQEHCKSPKRTRRRTMESVSSTSPRNNLETQLSLESNVGVFSNEFITSSEEDVGARNSRFDGEELDVGTFLDDDDAVSLNENNIMNHEDADGFGTFHNSSASLAQDFHLISCGNLSLKPQRVKCYPKPDALNPCEDVMGSNWLRVPVWIVVSFTVFGNVAVLVVILSSRSGVSVFKFLVSNLAFADLCTGLYLLLVASMDIHSIREYFNYAFDWQYGLGCKTAGFLTVFASNLSVYTLTVITVERWLTITYAIYLKKRINLRTAVFIMLGGWIYSIGIALLPLFGFSNYSSTSICLPMQTKDWHDISFLLALLTTSALAFIIIAISYSRIYFSLGKETRQAEVAVAKKMVLLVFTNFVCFAPILFFALTAMAGYPLIDVAKSKILLVFFYPLNSCANPYLYAIITTQYRKDLFTLLAKCGLCSKRAQRYKISYSIPTLNHTTVPLMISQNNHSSSFSSSTERKAKAPPEANGRTDELREVKARETEI